MKEILGDMVRKTSIYVTITISIHVIVVSVIDIFVSNNIFHKIFKNVFLNEAIL